MRFFLKGGADKAAASATGATNGGLATAVSTAVTLRGTSVIADVTCSMPTRTKGH